MLCNYMHFSFQLFSEHQMSKIKKSEEISVEREKEIQQVNCFATLSALHGNLLLLSHGFV